MPKIAKLIVRGIVAAVVVLIAGTFIYIHFVEKKAPAGFDLGDPTIVGITTTTPAASGNSSSNASGQMWQATSASQVGYRIKENLFGQDTTAVGRTNSVTGTLGISDKTVDTVDLSVDMTTVKSDQDRRDGQFQRRIMETSTYPVATFKLTKPIALKSLPDSTIQTASATGDLTMHGKTNSITTDFKFVKDGDRVKVNGSIPIRFADYDIQNPSFTGVTTEDHGILELLVVFAPKG